MGEMVRLISSSRVSAPSEISSDHHKVELTSWDLQLLLFVPSQQGLLFHKPQNMTNLIPHLKTSLSKTLTFFPPLAGRLSRTDDEDNATASFFIDCNNAGAQFDHAKAESVSVSDILDSTYVPRVVDSLFPPNNGFLNLDGVTQPLLAVQVTELADAVFVGCNFNHVVMDGTSFWHFFNSWSEMARGLGTVSRPPLLERRFLSGIECPVRIPLEQLQLNEDDPPHEASSERVYHFSKDKMAQLKARANAEMGTDKISSLQALVAHFWRCVIRTQRVGHEEDVYFAQPISVRWRLNPPLPDEYFGNAVDLCLIKLKAGEVLEHGSEHSAWEMNKAIGAQTNELIIHSCLKSWSENPSLISPKKAMRAMKNCLTAAGSPRFNVYDVDMGWGRPIAPRGGPLIRDGYSKFFLYPHSLGDGIELHAILPPSTFDALHKDSQFTDILTV